MAVGTGDVVVTKDKVYSEAWRWGIFFVRVALGVIFFMHGSQKVMGWNGGFGLQATAQFMGDQLGLPAWLAYVSAFTEFVGGILLVLGLFSRIAAMGLLINMIVAVWKVHWAKGFFLAQTGNGYEYNLALIAMCLAIIISGPGAIALADPEGKVLSGERD